MRIGGSIALGVLGAILYFAVTADVAGVSLPTVGLILMIAGGVWFLVELVQGFAGDTTTRASSTSDASASGTRESQTASHG